MKVQLSLIIVIVICVIGMLAYVEEAYQGNRYIAEDLPIQNKAQNQLVPASGEKSLVHKLTEDELLDMTSTLMKS